MAQQSKNGIVVGRFQPFHNGHLAYVLKALERCDVLYIGITTPGETSTKYEPQDENRLGKANNPFSYEERVAMIKLALADEKVNFDRIHFVHFDPANIKSWYESVPKDAVYFLLLLSNDEQKKVNEMEAQGLKVVVLETKVGRQHAAGEVRAKIKKGDIWEELVPKSVARYLIRHNAIERLKR